MRFIRALPLLAATASVVCACATGVNNDDSFDAGTPVTGNDASIDHGTDAGSGYDVTSGNDTGAPDTQGGGVESAAESSTMDSSKPTDSGNPADGPAEIGNATCAGHGFSGVLVTYDLSAQSGSETSAAAASSAPGVTGGALSRAPALTATSGSGSINSSNWGTGSSADTTKYYTLTLTPASGCTVALTTMALDVKASTTGPATGDVATSADSFGVHGTSFAGTSTPSVSLGVSGGGAIELRVYGYGASSTGGTFRVQNTLTVSGSIQ